MPGPTLVVMGRDPPACLTQGRPRHLQTELARRINRNASTVRRLCAAGQTRPELPFIAALAHALGTEIRVGLQTDEARRAAREHDRRSRRGHWAAVTDGIVELPMDSVVSSPARQE